jgi:hypothetical protein
MQKLWKIIGNKRGHGFALLIAAPDYFAAREKINPKLIRFVHTIKLHEA